MMKRTVAGAEEDVLEVAEEVVMAVGDIGSEDGGSCYPWVSFVLV